MVLVFVEEPGDLTQQALAFARTLGEPLDALCIGEEMPIHGVETLHVAEGDAYSAYAPGAIAQALVELSRPAGSLGGRRRRHRAGQRGPRSRGRQARPAVRGELRRRHSG